MNSSPSALYGRTVLFWFLGFFLTIFLVLATMVTLAVRTNTGVVTDHPYEKGLAYNDVITAAEAQAQKQWRATLSFTGSGKESGTLRFALNDAQNHPILLETMRATLFRPTQAGMDQPIEFKKQNEAYIAHITAPSKGSWEVQIQGTIQGAPYYFSERIVVQ